MFKKLLGIAPTLEADGSYSPSRLALRLAVPPKTDYEKVNYEKYEGERVKVLVLCTEQKDMTMKNGKRFSTGNHPVEAILPMLHLRDAGFQFDIVTPTGQPAVLEMWAMPREDQVTIQFYEEYKQQFENPGSLKEFIETSLDNAQSYAAIFVPGGHGVMLGLPEDPNVGKVLTWAHENDLFTITLCHGPGALLSMLSETDDFIYKGYKMTVFPDSVDQQTPMVGYLPGHMPWKVCEKLKALGVSIINRKSDSSTCRDRKLLTGASPLAANNLGKLAANTLLEELN